jgi:hypothetical protein
MASDKAKNAVTLIMADLMDRGGIQNAFEECEDEIRQEIEQTMAEIIDDAMKPDPVPYKGRR